MNDIKKGGKVLWFGSVKGDWFYDGRISLSVLYFAKQTEAEKIAKSVAKQGCKYNGGWFDGTPCGREPARDFQDNNGTNWYAVTC